MKNQISICVAVLLLFLANFSAFAQKDSTNQWQYEIGLGIPIVAFSKNYFLGIPAQNISLKVVRDKNVLRTGISSNLAYTRLNEDDKNYGFLANVGYERRFFNKRSQLFAGFDFAYEYHYRNSTGSLFNDQTWKKAGIGPVAGYIFNVTQKLSFQTEFSLLYGIGTWPESVDWEPNIFFSHRGFSLHAYYRF